MALTAGVAPRTLQEFLARYKWDENALRQRLHQIIARAFHHLELVNPDEGLGC
jgi:hypothetical protein